MGPATIGRYVSSACRTRFSRTPRFGTAALVALVLASTNCAAHKSGDCLQHTGTGNVWRITAVPWGKGYTAQGWLGDRWGIPVEGAIPDASDYVKVECPFSGEAPPRSSGGDH